MDSNHSVQNQIDGYLKLTEIQSEALYKRRDLEWRVSLSYWASIAIPTGFLLKNAIEPKGLEYIYYMLFIVSVLRVAKISQAHQTDKLFIQYYRLSTQNALGKMRPKADYPKPASFWFFLRDLWAWINILVSATLLLASFTILQYHIGF